MAPLIELEEELTSEGQPIYFRLVAMLYRTYRLFRESPLQVNLALKLLRNGQVDSTLSSPQSRFPQYRVCELAQLRLTTQAMTDPADPSDDLQRPLGRKWDEGTQSVARQAQAAFWLCSGLGAYEISLQCMVGERSVRARNQQPPTGVSSLGFAPFAIGLNKIEQE